MKSIITLVALAIMASPSFAATTKKAAKTAKTSTTSSAYSASHTADSSNTYSAHTPTSHDGLNMQAGLGLGTISSTFAFGVRGQGLVPVSKMEAGDILVGGETGFLYGPATYSVWMIPIMAEGQFNFKGNGKITPYAGLSMGITIAHVNTPAIVSTFLNAAGQSTTSTDFAIMAKGGLFFGEEQNLYAELPLGTMGSAFAIIPTFGMKF